MKLATLLRRAALRIEDAKAVDCYYGMCYVLHEASMLGHPPNVFTTHNDNNYYWYAYAFMRDWTWPTLAQHGFEKVLVHVPISDYWWPCTEKFVQTRIDALNLLADYAEYLDL